MEGEKRSVDGVRRHGYGAFIAGVGSVSGMVWFGLVR